MFSCCCQSIWLLAIKLNGLITHTYFVQVKICSICVPSCIHFYIIYHFLLWVECDGKSLHSHQLAFFTRSVCFFFFCLFIDLHVFKIAEYVWFFDIFVMYLSSQKMHYTWCHYWSFIYVRLKWKMHIYRKWNVIAKRNSTTMP